MDTARKKEVPGESEKGQRAAPRSTGPRKRMRDNVAQVDAFAGRIVQLRRDASEREQPAGWIQDLLERQRYELELALEELRTQLADLEGAHARLQELLDTAPDAYITTDSRGTILESNRAAASLLGMPQEALLGKLLIGFVARRDVRAFRARLAAAPAQAEWTFPLKLRPRGGVPFGATLLVRQGHRSAVDPIELRWTIRPDSNEVPAGERNLLSAIGEQLRAALPPGASRLAAIIDDIDRIAHPSAPGLSRSVVTPAWLVEAAVECIVALAPGEPNPILVGSLEEGARCEVVPEQAIWALARLFSVVGLAGVRGWRQGASFVLEVRSNVQRDLAAHRGAEMAIHAVLAGEGGMLRVSPADDDDDDRLVCEVTLPTTEREPSARP